MTDDNAIAHIAPAVLFMAALAFSVSTLWLPMEAGIVHWAGFHAAARHLGENLLPEGPERLDRRTGLRLAKLRVKLRFPMGVA